ncbi:glycosyltransferase family 8 protein [Jaapia argillacea MUCL 33604]|uniref:Glycosyltransferase family 8 protein n=1 Tax=Jaapia argillacea MUCL 33604 TaxID=933084 RepID=A0A067QQY3_9AGAM|nr:glycosyltransferase family 8 protein [Jaapia argillacea MUCL 33604]
MGEAPCTASNATFDLDARSGRHIANYIYQPKQQTANMSSTQMPNQSDYIFTPTQDWFSFNIDTWRKLFPHVKAEKPRILEIGSWEGRSAVFLLEELCTKGGEIVCIDHFDLMKTPEGCERYRKIKHNLALTGKPFRVLDQFSFPALMSLLEEEMLSSPSCAGFDWVYVDGSHEADDTFLDGELSWRMAKIGSIFIFDDYNWDRFDKDSIHHPRRGIDAFLQLHKGEYEILSSPEQYQMVLKKTSDMRIGFLVKDKADRGLADAYGYGMNIALTIGSSYAIPAAVAMRSVVDTTKGRITFYVVDCGLTDADKDRIRRSIPERVDVDLLFLELPEESLAAELGVVWAKIDIIKIVPVEKVLYLDADTLVRSDLRELWNVELGERALAAAVDVGYPMGHDGMARAPYFNAGVLLLDLAKARERLSDLVAMARAMKDARFRDQDVLNIHFAERWSPLSLKWNAQGLGTYANQSSADRSEMGLEEMKEPSIVHFTGAMHPELAVVLNPWVQPYTSKPWGYAGAPGHPFEKGWWAMVDKTAWKGYRNSKEYKKLCEEEKGKALQAATNKFDEIIDMRINAVEST